MLSPQVFVHVTTEGGGRERGDGANLPRFNSPGVARGTRQPCSGSFTQDNGGYHSLCQGDSAIEYLTSSQSDSFFDKFFVTTEINSSE